MIRSVTEIPPVDYIVCAHKALDQEEVATHLRPVVAKDTTIVIIQNGVGNEEPFRKEFPGNTILTCVVSHPCLDRGLVDLIAIRLGLGQHRPALAW